MVPGTLGLRGPTTSKGGAACFCPPDSALLASARDSERIYFALGARTTLSLPWSLHVVPDFEHLPAAAVCLLDVGLSAERLPEHLHAIERSFVLARVSRSRIYVTVDSPRLREQFSSLGYTWRCEIVHGVSIAEHSAFPQERGRWEPVDSDRGWREKQQLHELPSLGSDGYAVSACDWVAFERQKAEVGGDALKFWLFVVDDVPVMTLGTMPMESGIVRIKNLYVHPLARGRGVGCRALGAFLKQEGQRGATAAVLFSLEGSVGQRLYASLGGRALGRAHEWSREL